MDTFSSVAEVQRKIRELEVQHKVAVSRLEKAELMKKEGAHYYHGTELPIDDAIFSLKEGQVRSVQIALEFYRHTLSSLLPAVELPVPSPAVKPAAVPAPSALPRSPMQGAQAL